MRKGGILAVLFTVIVQAAAMMPVAAQDQASGPAKYFYVVRIEVEDTDVAAYKEAVEQLVVAHEQHEKGNYWATFSQITGGPKAVYYVILTMDKIGAIDDWLPNRQVVTEALGAEKAEEIFGTLAATGHASNMVLRLNEGLSRLDPEMGAGPPPIAWVFKLDIAPGAYGEQAALLAKVKEAHEKHEQGLYYMVWDVIIGGRGGSTMFAGMGMKNFAEMDTFMAVGNVLEAAFGEDEAKKIDQRLDEIGEGSSAIWVLTPKLSHLPAMAGAEDE